MIEPSDFSLLPDSEKVRVVLADNKRLLREIGYLQSEKDELASENDKLDKKVASMNKKIAFITHELEVYRTKGDNSGHSERIETLQRANIDLNNRWSRAITELENLKKTEAGQQISKLKEKIEWFKAAIHDELYKDDQFRKNDLRIKAEINFRKKIIKLINRLVEDPATLAEATALQQELYTELDIIDNRLKEVVSSRTVA